MNFPGANLIVSAIFLVCLVTLGVGALIAVLSQRLIRSVCGLAICSIGLAGLYYFLHSPFLALMEILIYIGAVCVTMVFAIMLAEPDEPANEEKRGATVIWGGTALTVAAAIFCGLGWLGTHENWPSPIQLANDGSIQAIGRSLLTSYSLAFELISLALLVAILGALAIARTGRQRVSEIPPPPNGTPLNGPTQRRGVIHPEMVKRRNGFEEEAEQEVVGGGRRS